MNASEFRAKASGVFAILITPFSEDGSVDVDGIHVHVERLARAGITGLIVNGTLSEFFAMSVEENKLCVRAAVEAAKGRMIVVAGASHSNTREALDMTQFAEEVGADAALLTAPYFSSPSEAGVIAHFEHVAANSGIALMLYNTSRAGRNLPVDFLRRLSEIPNVAALKQGTRDIVELETAAAKLRDQLCVIGVEETMLASMMYGARGFTSAAAMVFPELIVRIHAAGTAGDIAEATRLYLHWQPYRFFHQSIGGPATHKAALRSMGLPAGRCRLPMLDLDEARVAELRPLLAALVS